MGLSLGDNPTGSESEVDSTILLNQNLQLSSDDETVTFNGLVGGEIDANELLFHGQLSYIEEGETKGSTLYHRVSFVDSGASRVATLSKYPNTPHPIVTVSLDKASGALTMKITHQDIDDYDRRFGTYRI